MSEDTGNANARYTLKGQSNFHEWVRLFKAESRVIGLYDWYISEKEGGRKTPVRPIYQEQVPAAQEGQERQPLKGGLRTEVITNREEFKFKWKLYQKESEEMNKANKFLIDRIEPSFFGTIAKAHEPVAKLSALIKVTCPSATIALDTLYAKMEGIKLHSKITVQEYINELQNTRADIISIEGGVYTDQQLKNKAIRGLPKSWNAFVEQYRLNSQGQLELEPFFNRLLTWEEILLQRKDNVSNDDSKGKDKPKNNNGGGDKKTYDACPTCKKRHPGGENECWFKHPEKNPYKNGSAGDNKNNGEKNPAAAPGGTRKISALASIDRTAFEAKLRTSMNADPRNLGKI